MYFLGIFLRYKIWVTTIEFRATKKLFMHYAPITHVWNATMFTIIMNSNIFLVLNFVYFGFIKHSLFHFVHFHLKSHYLFYFFKTTSLSKILLENSTQWYLYCHLYVNQCQQDRHLFDRSFIWWVRLINSVNADDSIWRHALMKIQWRARTMRAISWYLGEQVRYSYRDTFIVR